MSAVAGVLLAAAFAAAGRAVRWLTSGGALCAGAVGSAVFVGGGVVGASLLTVFFLSGSLLGDRPLTGDERVRTTRHGRSTRQVLANGLWAGVGGLMLVGGVRAGWPVLAGALAAAQADTWATQLGTHARRQPRLITTGRPVTPGTSGGITLVGTLGGVAGGTVMAAVVWMAGLGWKLSLAALIGAIVGLHVDSLLGASIQGIYRCDRCGRQTERRRHAPHHEGQLVRGQTWVDNDIVNLMTTACGAITALGVAALA